MKQLLFLLLFPAYAMAQYPGNAGQKITLGEQTTADGLVYRGVASDTTRKPSVDTMAYILLDTNTNIIWQYKKATSNAWLKVNITPADTTTFNYVNTYGTQTVNGAKTFTSELTATKLNVTDSIQSNTGIYKINSSTLGLNVDNSTPFRITNTGNWGIYNDNPQNLLNSFSSSARGGVISNNYPILMFNELNKSKFIFGLDENEGYLWGFDNVKLIIATNTTEKMRIETNGEVNIGYGATDNGAYLLQVKDSVYVGGNVSASAYTTRSDYDLKDEIQNISYGINEVMQMQPVKYTYKSNGSTQLGFIAQDLGVITPEVVSFEDKMSVYYNALIPILTKAIQEQQSLIKALEQRILILENK